MLQAFFCDDAASDGGKLHITGIFDELVAEGFPARHDRLVVCALLHWSAEQRGRKAFSVDLLDPGGQSIFTVEGHTDVVATSPGRAPARTHLVLPLRRVVFPEAGRYRTRFIIDGDQHFGPDLYLSDRRALT